MTIFRFQPSDEPKRQKRSALTSSSPAKSFSEYCHPELAAPETLRCGIHFSAELDGLSHVCDLSPGHESRHYCRVHEAREKER